MSIFFILLVIFNPWCALLLTLHDVNVTVLLEVLLLSM